MSVRTRADEMLDDVDAQIRGCIVYITQIISNSVWGADEYSKEYDMALVETLKLLVEAKAKLNR